MLQDIRDNAQGTIAKIIVGLIILTFAIFGTDAIVQSFYGEPEVAEVNGEVITQADFEKLVERKRRQLINQMGENFDPSLVDTNALRKQALEEAIQRELLKQLINEKGLVVADKAIEDFIRQWPLAQADGRYDQDQFQRVLGSIGLSYAEFRNELNLELAAGQLQAGLAGTAFATPMEVKAILGLDGQERDFRYKRLAYADVLSEIEVSDAEVAQHYKTMDQALRVPEQVVVQYVEYRKDAALETVALDEDTVQAAVQAEIERSEGDVQRRVSHILFEKKDGESIDALKDRAAAVRKEIEGGLSFAEAAEKHSQDPGSASAGGELGVLSPGLMGEPAFDEAFLALSEGEISAPVTTSSGVHLITVTDSLEGSRRTPEQIQADVRKTLQESASEDAFVELRTRLEDMTYSAPDLQEAAEELSLEVKTSPAFSRAGGEGLWARRDVLDQAFSADVLEEGHNSQVIDLSRDHLMVLRIQDRRESHVPTLTAVREQVENDLRKTRAKAILDQRAEKLLGEDSSVRSGWTKVEMATRHSPGDEIPIAEVFRLARPGSDGTTMRKVDLEDGVAVIELLEVREPDSDKIEAQERAIAPMLADRYGSVEYQLFLDAYENQASIERNP